MTGQGENCPLDFVVATENNCKNVAIQLTNNKYWGSNGYGGHWTNAPAGCWYNGDSVYLNTITDPSRTSPNSHLRGICHKAGTEYMFFFICILHPQGTC